MTTKPSTADLQRQITENLAATTRLLKESEERHAKYREEDAKRRAAEEKRGAILDARLAKTDKMIKNLGKEVGGIGNERGFSFERAVFNTLMKMDKLGDVRLDDVLFNIISGKKGYQFDIIGVNGKSTLVIEAKVTLSLDGVRTFADERLPIFTKVLPDFDNGKKIIGAMIYERTDPKGEAVAEALSRGLLLYCADNKKHLHPVQTRTDIIENTNPAKK